MRQSKAVWVGTLLLGSNLLGPMGARAAETPPAPPAAPSAAQPGNPPVTQKTDKGEINWSQKTITVTGSGAFSNSASNAAQARLMATKAAKMDAQRNLLEIVKGVKLTTGTTAQKMMSTNEVRNKVDGLVRNFEIVDTKYFSDGGVDVIIRASLDSFADALLEDGGSKAQAQAPGQSGANSALIIDAKGLGLEPALAPKVFDEKGNEIFSAAVVSRDKLRENGVCAYARSLDAAKNDKRSGGKPLIVKALKLMANSKTDVVLSAKDLQQLTANGQGFLSEGKLVLIVD